MRDTPHRTITEFEDRLRRANEVIKSSYTLAELRVLAHEFLQTTDSGLGVDGVTMRLKLSIFLASLAKREREGLE